MNKKNIFLFIFVIIIVGFAIGWILLNPNQRTSISTVPSSPISIPNSSSGSTSVMTSLTPPVQTNTAKGTKTYRNTEFEFEFQYPENWSFKMNSFYSPFSKFNLEAHSPDIPYNPFNPFFVVNIVTPDFADRAIISRKNLDATTSTIIVAAVKGIKYEYVFEGIPQIDVDLPFIEYRILIGAHKEYEAVFDQILASFKFLK